MAIKKIGVDRIRGFRLGNAESSEKGTGCTVIICEEGAVGGVDVRGGGPATRETDLLRSENTVNSVNAVVLSGGSAFGLEAASGVMRELADRNIGFSVGDGLHVPIVCGASLYDLPMGDPKAFPDVEMGREAVRNAYDGRFSNGNHGAGTGATVGKMQGYERAMKTGIGTFACGDGFIEVGAIAAVNAVGDIYNGAGNIIAGLRSEDGQSIYGTIKALKGMVHDKVSIVDDSTTFIKKADIEDVLAAAARQYEEEKALEPAAETPSEEPAPVEAEASAEEFAAEAVEEQAAASNSEETVSEEVLSEEHVAAVSEEEISEEPAETVPEETVTEEPAGTLPEETVSEEPLEAAYPEDEAAEEAPVQATEAYEEPEVITAAAEEPQEEPALAEEPQEVTAVYEEPVKEEPAEEPVVLTREEMGYDITFNTTISCLITNAILTKSQANKLASILHDAYARAIKPVHGTLDGDTVFVLATGKQQVNFDAFAALATDVLQYAIIDGALSAEGAYGLPAARDIKTPER